jgi:hypothetical protein
MAYYPKNRIKTNLYTDGKEYRLLGTNSSYIGFYWSSYVGRFFTGKNPNDVAGSKELEKIPANEPDPRDNSRPPTEKKLNTNITVKNAAYTRLKRNFSISNNRLLPFNIYPSPTDADYNLGAFTRYFAVKENENVYLEINKETYQNLESRNIKWAFELYIPFTILWTIKGNMLEVQTANSNITKLTQQRLRKDGLTQFLKGNYLQFYREDDTTDQIIPPDDLSSPPSPLRTTTTTRTITSPPSYTPPPSSPSTGGGY